MYSQNYESASDASSWVNQNLAPTLETDNTKYIQVGPAGSTVNSRSSYTVWGNSFYGDYTSYTLEFDAAITATTGNTRNQMSQLVVMADGYTLPNANNEYTSTYLFAIKSTANTTTFTPNGDSEKEFTMPAGVWCHYSIVVDSEAGTAVYTITNKSTSTEIVSGSYTILGGTNYKAVGLYYLCGRYNSVGKFDNMKISTEVDASVSNPPSFTYKSYSGANRTYTLENPNGGGTLYYTTSPAAVAPAVGDAAYSSTTDLSKDVTYSASGNYYAYVVNASDVVSTVTPQAVTAEAPVVADGTYYLKNKNTGAYLAAGLQWGTQAITNNIGHSVTLTFAPLALTYTIDTSVSNGGYNHFLTNELWCDGAAKPFSIASDGEGYYTINYGGNHLTAGAVGEVLSLTDGTGDNTKWQILTAAEWKAENVARLAAATANSGVDATFYIPAANFNRNDNVENAKWQGSPAIGGLDGSGIISNFNAEKFNGPTTETCHEFDVYQALTSVKPGAYKLTAQGFYRDGTTDNQKAKLYANTAEVILQNIHGAGITAADADKGFTTANAGYYVPNTQAEAAKAFNNGYYNNEVYVVVGDDGALRLGVKKTDGVLNDWTIFDNFQLTYYGTTVPKTISAAGYATFCSPYALDFSEVDGLTAYIITGYSSGNTLNLVQVDDVPANTGVLLAGEAGTYNIPVKASSSTSVTANKLVGVTAETAGVAAGIYVLMNESAGVGFYETTNAFTVGANTAYLPADFASVAAKMFLFNDAEDVTGIATVETGDVDNAPAYNVAGQRVAANYKGIVIKNGKKYLNK